MKKYLKVLLTMCIVLGMVSTVFAGESDDKPFEYESEELGAELAYYLENYCAWSEADLAYAVDNSVGMSKEIFEQLLTYAKDDTLGEFVGLEDKTKVENKDEIVEVTIVAKFDKASLSCVGTFEYLLSKPTLTDISFNLVTEDKSMGEKITDAALNTVMGMGIVVCVLLLISFIISLFRFIPKLQEMFSDKGNKEVEAAVDNTVAQITEKEELVDDTELVAVITAAICAATNTSGDSFVVRSIRKRKF